MRWIVAPDSFKGSLSAVDAARAMSLGLRRADPGAVWKTLPMADGGEGSLDALHAALGGRWQSARVNDAAGHGQQVQWLRLPDGRGVIEVARVVGLLQAGATDLALRDTRGVGQLMLACLDAGVDRLAIALGGSSTNDGGAGCLAALGARFLDRDGNVLLPHPSGLENLHSVDVSMLDPRVRSVDLEIWSDVDNPLLGMRGATSVFGPQKGVTADRIAWFDGILSRLAGLCDAAFGRSLSMAAGSGAAGGLGYALQLLRGTMVSGGEAVSACLGLEAAMDDCDWVLVGEGRSDAQTLSGKAPLAVARLARRKGVPVTLLSGAIQPSPALHAAFDGCFSVCSGPMTLPEAQRAAADMLADATEQVARTILAARRDSVPGAGRR